MTTVRAAQIVYTRVERERSPRRVAGFQTVFYTQQVLPTDVVEEAELYFGSNRASASEGGLVFGRVGKKDLLLARRTPVSEVDRCGRGGNYIAHAVVFSEDDFLALGGNPIEIARHIPFFTQLTDALNGGDNSSGDIPPLEVRCVRPGKDLDALTEGWSTDNLANLLVLATCAERLSGRDAPIAVIGSATDVADVLELVFSIMPHALRCRLSFDTHGSSSKQAMQLWACGFRDEPSGRLPYHVDARQKTADSLDGNLTLSSFTNWLRVHVCENGATNLARWGEAAWPLCHLIDQGVGVWHTQFGDVDAYLAERVWRANQGRAESRLLRRLQEAVGTLLAERVVGWLLANYEETALFQSMIRPDEEQIIRGLHAEYSKLHKPPSQDERRELERLAYRRSDNRLAIWLCAWSKDWSQLKERLGRLSDDEYRIAAAALLILDDLEPLRLYVLGRGRLFAEAIAHTEPDSKIDLAGIVQHLVREGETDGLLPLAPLLAGQSRASLFVMRRSLQRKHVGVAPAFFAALEHALEEQKSQRSWLRSMFGTNTSRSRRA